MAINKRLLKGAAAAPIVSTDHFNTLTYTGDGSSSNSITGLNFQPDFVWIKSRTGTRSHALYDSTRGPNKRLVSNGTQAEISNSAFGSFDSGGFTVTGTDTSSNNNGEDYVSWCWRFNGGTTSSNTDGNVTTTVQANTTAGFSLVTWVGTGIVDTFGHGLNSAPELVIIKNKTDVVNWSVGATPVGWTKYLKLNLPDAAATSSVWWSNTAPTSSVVTVGPNNSANALNDDIVMYCFHSVSGFSKIGSYTGNGSTTGPTVTTGFQPRFLMVKNYSTASTNWRVVDSVRGTSSTQGAALFPNLNNIEQNTSAHAIDFQSNGFQIRTSSSNWNGNGDEHLYLAIA